MARGVRLWFAENPPSAWIRFLEVAVRALNWVLLALGLAVAAWSLATVVLVINEPPAPPAPPAPVPPPPPAALLAHPATASTTTTINQPHLSSVPWFIWAFGSLGLATALTAGTALLGIRLRSPGCMSSHIFFMCLLLTGQACAAVAFFMDAGWEKRLPDIDEKLKEFLAHRLQVCKWLGVGLMLLQLLELLLGCGLQGVYVGAEEAAEDADEEAAWRRRPLMHQQERQGSLPSQPSPGGGGAGAGAADSADPDGWRARMQQQYGLDTSQFSYRPGGEEAAGGGSGGRGERSRGCSIM